MKVLFSLVASFGVLGLVACRPKTCDVDKAPKVQVLVAADQVNQGPDGESWPTEVVLLEVEKAPNESTLRFDNLSESEDENLGLADVLRVHRITIFPGEPVVRPLELDPKAEFLVMIARFRKHVGDGWFQVHRVRRERACDNVQHPESTPDPCLYFLLEDYELIGGEFPPVGFDRGNFQVQCAAPVKSVSYQALETNNG